MYVVEVTQQVGAAPDYKTDKVLLKITTEHLAVPFVVAAIGQAMDRAVKEKDGAEALKLLKELQAATNRPATAPALPVKDAVEVPPPAAAPDPVQPAPRAEWEPSF